MKPNGCAVYVKSNENHYLISATHVLDTFKNRCGVQLNNQAIVPKGKLLSEREWRDLGVQQSVGWEHYAVHRPEPHILLFRRPLSESPNPPATSKTTESSNSQMQAIH